MTKTRVAETEKITINVGYVDLGQMDLLVDEGFYSNRTDLIRTAIRNELALHRDAVRQAVARRTLVLGMQPAVEEPQSALEDRGSSGEGTVWHLVKRVAATGAVA